MLWMGDTVIDIDRLIVTVISTRGWMLDASNRLCWLAHCLLLACCALFSLASLRLLVSWAGQDWNELDNEQTHEGRRSQVGPGTVFQYWSTGGCRARSPWRETTNSKLFLLELHSDPKGWEMKMKMKMKRTPFSKLIHVGTMGDEWMNEWMNQSINQRTDGWKNKLTGNWETQRTPKEGKRQARKKEAP